MNKPENKHVAAILIAYENTVWLCLDWFDSAGSYSGPKRFEAVQAGGLSDIFPCNSNLVTLMTGKAKQTGWLLSWKFLYWAFVCQAAVQPTFSWLFLSVLLMKGSRKNWWLHVLLTLSKRFCTCNSISCLSQPHSHNFLPSSTLFPLLSYPQWCGAWLNSRLSVLTCKGKERGCCILLVYLRKLESVYTKWSYSRCVQVERNRYFFSPSHISWLVRFINVGVNSVTAGSEHRCRKPGSSDVIPSSLHQVSAAALEVFNLFQTIIKSLW